MEERNGIQRVGPTGPSGHGTVTADVADPSAAPPNELARIDPMVTSSKLEAVGQLAAGVAHEINTPVQYLTDNVAFLAETIDELLAAFDEITEIAARFDGAAVAKALAAADMEFLREEIPAAITQSQDGLAQVTEIVRAMKDFSHPGGRLNEADLNEAVTMTATISRNEWKYVAELDLRLDPDLPPVVCDEAQVRQVVLNLVVNAAHAIADAFENGPLGTITVATTQLADEVCISVADNGCGMSPEVRTRIFDKFFTTKQVGRGTGQGLAVARQIVAAHHGRIEVDSALGSGTTFQIFLPVEGPAGPSTAADNSEQ